MPAVFQRGHVEILTEDTLAQWATKRAWRGLGYQQDHCHLSRRQCTLFFVSSMVIVQQNSNRGKNDGAMLKFIIAILPERIQWCWGVPLAFRIGGYATSSNMNESAATNNTILQRRKCFNDNRKFRSCVQAPFAQGSFCLNEEYRLGSNPWWLRGELRHTISDVAHRIIAVLYQHNLLYLLSQSPKNLDLQPQKP